MTEINGTVYYSLGDLLGLKQEYLNSLSQQFNEWYGPDAELHNNVLVDFFGWINIRNNTP